MKDKMKALWSVIVLAAVSLGGCNKYTLTPDWRPGPPLPPCTLGRAFALQIDESIPRPTGPDAVGQVGDYLLANDQAAYVIEGIGPARTYYYYPGILVDAVAVEDCAYAVPEQFEELGLYVGRLDINNLAASGLRGFHGESIEVISDGADGGDAVVRVHGRDDIFWIAELELIKQIYQMGSVKPITSPFGIEMYIDYILPPDSAALRIELHLVNTEPAAKQLITGASAFYGDATRVKYYYNGATSLLGYSTASEVPYVVSSAGNGAWAFAMERANMGSGNIAGIMAFIDGNQLSSPLNLAPAGEAGDDVSVTYYFAVGKTDYNSAVEPLLTADPEPQAGATFSRRQVSGRVADSGDDSPLAGVEVEFQNQNRNGEWLFHDGFISGPDGMFSGLIPDRGHKFRLHAHLDGRPDYLSPTFFLGDTSGMSAGETASYIVGSTADFPITLDPGGSLLYSVSDNHDRSLPCKILLWQNGVVVKRIFSTLGYGLENVAPGTYDVSVTRGFEYTTGQGTITVAPNEMAVLQKTLTRAVDTSGYLSMDGHLHAGPSADNTISIPERIATVAAEGLEVPVSTDHELIVPWQSGIVSQGLTDWVATVVGEEVTAVSPEHTNMYGVPLWPEAVKGGPVDWFGLDLPSIFAAERLRGAQLVQLNHPRNGCNYMCLIQYNRLTGLPGLTDPTVIGLPAGATLWSWDFDLFEWQNGNQDPFINPSSPDATGTFEDWMSFLNLGHRVTAVSNTDAHNYETPGAPRTYFASPTDDPASFQESYLIDALRAGRAVTSTGAFARVTVNGAAGLGDVITDRDGTVSVKVHIEAIPEIDVTRFKVFVNCRQAASVNTTSPGGVVKYDGTVNVTVPTTRDANIVVMGFGAGYLPRGFPQFSPTRVPRFATNAIYIDGDGSGTYTGPGTQSCTYTLP